MEVFGLPIQIFATIAASLVAALIGIWALFHVGKLNARRTASIKFRAAILATFSGLYPLPTEWPNDIDQRLCSIFPELQIAIAEFRPFVPWYCRWAFDHAWSRYRNAYGRDADYQCYHHYMAFGSNPDPKGQFRRNVDLLLSFAKQRLISLFFLLRLIWLRFWRRL